MTPMLLAIDPGNQESAFVIRTGTAIADKGKVANRDLLTVIDREEPTACVIEMIASYGMPVGAEVFQTCVWIGRFVERWSSRHAIGATLVFRRDVKLHLCGSARAKDGNIRQALIDRHGGQEAAIGKKASPGPLYGVKADIWAALALAITFEERPHV